MDHRTMIENARTRNICGQINGVVLFPVQGNRQNSQPVRDSVSPENIQLTLKSIREPEVKGFEPLEPATLEG